MISNGELRELLVAYQKTGEPSLLEKITVELYSLISEAYASLLIDFSWNKDQCISIGHEKLLHLITNPDILKANSIRAFIRKSLKNAMLDALKYNKEILSIDDDTVYEIPELSEPSPEEKIADYETGEERLFAVMEAIDSLPVIRRVMLYLYFFAGWTFQEIADSFGWGKGVKGHASVYVKRATQELSSHHALRSLFKH